MGGHLPNQQSDGILIFDFIRNGFDVFSLFIIVGIVLAIVTSVMAIRNTDLNRRTSRLTVIFFSLMSLSLLPALFNADYSGTF